MAGILRFKRAAIQLFVIVIINTFVCEALAQTTAPASLEGRVTSIDAKPLPGARVAVYGYDQLQTATTDALGKFRVNYALCNGLLVVVQSDGYGICLVRVPGDSEDDPLEIPLRPATSVRIRVVNPDGSPAAGVRVGPAGFQMQSSLGNSIFPDPLTQQLAQTSDASGYCTFMNLPQETEVNFNVLDERAVSTYSAAQTTDAPTIEAIEPIHLQIGGIIEGRILFGDNGKPAMGVRVNDQATIETGNRYTQLADTDTEGKFRITHLRPGNHQLEVRLTSPLNEKYLAPKLEPFPLAAGQLLGGKEIKLESGTAIHGKATIMGTDAPAVGASIQVLIRTGERSSNSVGQAKVEPDGTYAIRVLPGVYRLSGDSAFRGALVPVNQRPTEYFTVEEGKDVNFDMVFRKNQTAERSNAGPIKGVILDESGQLVAGAFVSLSYGTDNNLADGFMIPGSGTDAPAMGNGSRTRTDQAGRFVLPVAGNGALLRVRKGSLALPEPLIVGNDRDLKLTLSSKTAGSAIVHVNDINGKPLAGVEVTVRVSDGVQALAARWGRTDANGAFLVSPVYPDRHYRVLVGGYQLTNGSADFVAETGKQVDVTPIVVHRAGSFITGKIVSEAGDPMPDVQVMVGGGRSGSKSVHSGPDGRFRVDDLVAGDSVSITTNAAGSIGNAHTVATGSEDVVIVHVPRSPAAARGR